jgi:RimJ/RimL family protein N-acetyltransferase
MDYKLTGSDCSTEAAYTASGGMTLRVARAADRASIIHIIDTIAGEGRYFFTGRYDPTPVWERILAVGCDEAAGLLLLVAEVGPALAGFGRLTAEPGRRRVGNIGLGLLAEYRGQGYGSALLARLVSWNDRLRFDRLTAAIKADNVRSRRLFARHGFVEAEQRAIVVPSAREAIDMVWVSRDCT